MQRIEDVSRAARGSSDQCLDEWHAVLVSSAELVKAAGAIRPLRSRLNSQAVEL